MKSTVHDNRRVCLVVIDGWGVSDCKTAPQLDAIKDASTPVMDNLSAAHNCCLQLAAHGLDVGLPRGLMGNSEVGHLNIGAGRVVNQDIVRIEAGLESGEMANSAALQHVADACRRHGRPVHLIGLLSDGGVHSHIGHLKALLECLKARGVCQALVHAITDGRDVGPTTALGYLDEIAQFMQQLRFGKLASVVGRFYAMDRDKRWERVKLAYDMYVGGAGHRFSSYADAIRTSYEHGVTDEFVKPSMLPDFQPISRQDGVLFFNFRSDRMRQIVAGFLGLAAEIVPTLDNVAMASMTQFDATFSMPVLSPPQPLDNVLAEWLSRQGRRQCHIAETEKYAHVTFFFNGGREDKFVGETRVLVPSPKVLTYDLQPEMSVKQVAQEVCAAIASDHYDFVLCNLAPPDMVGHTGRYEETVLAVEATGASLMLLTNHHVDSAIGTILEACRSHNNWVLVVTSDHGNAEVMSKDGQPHTAHTCSKVPLVVHCPRGSVALQAPHDRPPALCDVAPTVLALMGLDAPSEMTGRSLLHNKQPL